MDVYVHFTTQSALSEIFCSTNNFNPDRNHYELINNLNNSNRIRYNETIQTICKYGYERKEGSETRTCIDDDIFKEPELSCQGTFFAHFNHQCVIYNITVFLLVICLKC